MDTLSYRTVSANKATVKKEWLLVDAENEILGRLASKIAIMVRGKHKPYYTPHVDCGDHVIVINAEKVRLTGKKWQDRKHFSHTGYPGGQKRISPNEIRSKNPAALVENAVRGMLPKNTLGRQLFRNLHVYAGAVHDHEAQQPKELKLTTLR